MEFDRLIMRHAGKGGKLVELLVEVGGKRAKVKSLKMGDQPKEVAVAADLVERLMVGAPNIGDARLLEALDAKAPGLMDTPDELPEEEAEKDFGDST